MLPQPLAKLFWVIVCSCTVAGALADESAQTVDYAAQVKPILSIKCYSCHGALKQESGLRLETRELMLHGGEGGTVIVPGKPGKSAIIQRVTAGGAEQMPPANEGSPLTDDEVGILRRWIDQGAVAPEETVPADPRQHWAFQPIARPPIPSVRDAGSVENPIDAFLQRQREQRGLTGQAEAERNILLRRLYLDLLGVPPSRQALEAFVNDESPDWYENAVQSLLDDPRHGQRWARHWMDIWRYSDWWGLGAQLRNSQKHMWHWRDWIVDSVNRDTSYDEMVRLMLAADELHPNDMDKLRATGFLARNYFLFNRPQWMEETVEHVGKGFLGLTMNCAKCHDHKFDPLEQSDFYRLRAVFEPYHVRLDVLPGESDLAKDGLPRVFDQMPPPPTYRYIRGDEKNPDETRVIEPGVPAVFDFANLQVQPVPLPESAWRPGTRPWVAQAVFDDARLRLQQALSEVGPAKEKLADARALAAKQASETPKGSGEKEHPATKATVSERFETLDETRWQLFGGKWSHKPGTVAQQKDGASRAVLRLRQAVPRDFDASVRFTIRGGSRWRSVGLSFDAAATDPTQDRDPKYHEQNVYVSAYAGGPKIHATYNHAGQWHYPPGPAVRSLPIALDREYTLRVQVQGDLINASLNDQLVIACRTPLARRDGALQLTNFDALTVFHEVQVRPLEKGARLQDAGTVGAAMAKNDVEGATATLKVAEAQVAWREAELTSVSARRRFVDTAAQDAEPLRVAAIRSEQQTSVAKARYELAIAEQALLAAVDKPSAEKKVKSAKESVQKAEAALQEDVSTEQQVTPFVGAKWTPTRFNNSGRDDAEVEFSAESSGRRSALAQWITDRRNPLTARVAVNHIWMRHMGQPLVPTVFDFGRRGTPPTHPELLDWLAAEWMESGWSMKHLHRLIVTSAAYRMKSTTMGAEGNVEQDPDNRYWWRRVPIRIESQVVRDALLSMSGTLDERLGGPPVLRAEQGNSLRRSMYFFHSNNERNLFLTTFDEALVKDCYRREESIVPQQALALTNSRLVLDAAEAIAARIAVDVEDDAEFTRCAFRVVLGVAPSEAEVQASLDALGQWKQLNGGSAKRSRANLIWALVNHNDFVTLR
ncbi:MAG: hypothetical protein CL681_15885 [Blastopirellula sp.]|nr:hypothetical protein [Blastopirellula sp.]